MHEEIQRIIEENIGIKKELQIQRNQVDLLENQLRDERQSLEEQIKRNTQINQHYCSLQRKYQNTATDHTKNVNTLASQIQELKSLIQEKQRQLENFQIRMIPSLDQDMLRVKIITEMQGPYQQTVDKKDRQILLLRQKVSKIQRKHDILQMNHQIKLKQHKRQNEDTKLFYQQENERLMRQLTKITSKKQIRTIERQTIRSQRNQITELKAVIELQSKNQQENRNQINSIRHQRQKLLLHISQLNEKKALEVHVAEDNSQLKMLKTEKRKLEESLQIKTSEIEKLDKKIKNLQKQNRKFEEQVYKMSHQKNDRYEIQIQELKDQILKHKEELRKWNISKDKEDYEYMNTNEKIKSLEKQLRQSKKYVQQYKNKVEDQEKTIKDYQFSRKQKLSLTKNIKDPERQKQNDQHQTNLNLTDKEKDHYKHLERNNQKLRQALEIANNKIIDLIQQKVKVQGQYPTNQRSRAVSNMDIDHKKTKSDKGILLEYRDVAMTPLVVPTIYTHK